MYVIQLFDTSGVSIGEVTIEDDDWAPMIGDSVPGTQHEIVDIIDRTPQEPEQRLIVQPMTY